MALLPYNYAQGTDEDEQQNSQSQNATSAGPAPYQPPQTPSSAGATAPGAQNQQAQASPQIQQAAQTGEAPPAQTPQTFAQQEAAGQARPPAPAAPINPATGTMSTASVPYAPQSASPSPYGNVGFANTPDYRQTSTQSAPQSNGETYNILNSDNTLSQLTPQQLSQMTINPQTGQATLGNLNIVGYSPNVQQAQQSGDWSAFNNILLGNGGGGGSYTGGFQDLGNGMGAPIMSNYNQINAPPPGSTPQYLQGGQTVGANGQPVAGGYNALNDYYSQTGDTPGVYNSQVQALLQQNPALAQGLTPQQQMSLASGQYSPLLGHGLPQSSISQFTQNSPSAPSGPTAPGIAPSAPSNPLPPGVSANLSPSGPALFPGGSGSPVAPSNPTPTPPALIPNPQAANGSGSNYSIPGALEAGAQGQGAGSQVQSADQQAALNLLNNPDPYNQSTVQQAYNWLSGNIQDQYTQQQQALGQEMAARGLGASSIYGGQLGDLNIAQRSAQEALGENLAQNLAQSQGQYEMGAAGLGNQIGNTAQSEQQNYIAQLMGYGQNAFQNSLESQMANQQASQAQEQYILGLLGLSYNNPYVG